MFQGWVLHGDALHFLTVFRVITIIINVILTGFCFRYLQYLRKNVSATEFRSRSLFTWAMISYSVAVTYGLMVHMTHADVTLRPGAILTLVAATFGCFGMAKLLKWKQF